MEDSEKAYSRDLPTRVQGIQKGARGCVSIQSLNILVL